MSQITFIPRHSFRKVQWKNRQGFTHEIYKSATCDADRFDWRLSIAEVKEDGRFSNFEGYQRNITVLDGVGMTLTVDGCSSGILIPFQPFNFMGDAFTMCQLIDGHIHDFNVIYDQIKVNASVIWLTPSQYQTMTLPARTHGFIIAGSGEATVYLDHSTYNLATWDVVHIETFDSTAILSFPGQMDAVLGVITITSRAASHSP